MEKTERVCIVPGSFDPITRGHVDIVSRASKIFDKVIVALMTNAEKDNGMFKAAERLEIAKCAIRNIEGAEAMLCTGLASDFAKEVGATYFVKGVRNATDFDYENSLSQIMKKFDESIETVFLPASPEYFYMSSTYARERIRYGCDLSDIADEKTAALIKKLYKK